MSLETAKEKFKELLDDSETTDLDIALFLRNYNPIEMFVIAQNTRADRSLVKNKKLWDTVGSEYLALINKKLLKRAPATHIDRYCLSLVLHLVSHPNLFSTLNIYETHSKELMFHIYNVDNGKLQFVIKETDGSDKRKLIWLIRIVLDLEIPKMYTSSSFQILVNTKLNRSVIISILYRIMQFPNVSVECPIENEGSPTALVQQKNVAFN